MTKPWPPSGCRRATTRATLLTLLALTLSACLPLPRIGSSEVPDDPVYLAHSEALIAAIAEIAEGLTPRPDYSPLAVTGRAYGFIGLSASSRSGDSTFLSFTLTGEEGRTTLTPRGGGPGARQLIAGILAELDRRIERAP